MRKRLIRLVGQRCVFRAVFIWFGKAYLPDNHIQRYMLIEDVIDQRGRHITKHMWMPLRIEDYIFVTLQEGNLIQFDAEVNVYLKRYKKRRILDYGLCRPANVQIVEQKLGTGDTLL